VKRNPGSTLPLHPDIASLIRATCCLRAVRAVVESVLRYRMAGARGCGFGSSALRAKISAAIRVPAMDRAAMYLVAHVYSVLAFAEVLVLFGSVIGILVLVFRQAVRGLNAVMDAVEAALDARSRGADPRISKPVNLNVAVESRSHKILGGHNERF
jgi:hypothetical protein